MRRSGRIHGYLRQHALGLVAIWIALTGTALALPGRNTVGSKDIRKGAVETRELARHAVEGHKVANDSLRGRKIREKSLDFDGSLTGDDIDASTFPFWRLGGNAGTTAGTDFLGTTDSEALELHVNGARALRLEPNATSPNLIGGFPGNSVSAGALGATIGGGGASGNANTVGADFGTVGGGVGNTASGDETTVAGGIANTASGPQATVAGGAGNTASGDEATVAGGFNNTANGTDAAVAGGFDNTASGDFSLVAGRLAKNANADHDGVFLFADTTGAEFPSAAANEFAARATGGYRFVSAVDAMSGATTAECTINPAADMTCDGSFNGTAFNVTSDRAAKTGFAPVDPSAVLERVARLPLSSWRYRGERGVRHLGPTAQAFRRAFGLGEDRRHIATVDADGVALAAIKGLAKEVERLHAQVRRLRR